MLLHLSLNEWLDLLETRHPRTIDLGLERSREVWERMGSPRPAGQIFTVAGTNGKGSTVAYLCGMLEALGYSFGSYTTPHLIRYNERVQINGIEATDSQLIKAFELVELARGDVSLSYFEFGTLAAIFLLNKANLDFAVMEIGLGGRLDAVNILDTDCAVITNVGLDHQEYLGDNRESIGREKAGIIRRNVPLVCGESNPPCSVMTEAARLRAPVFRLGRDFYSEDGPEDNCYTGDKTEIRLPRPAMIGLHQVNNQATALTALLQLLPQAEGWVDRLVQGLVRVSVPGRLQQVSEHPRVYVDVGHNSLAAEAVLQVLGEFRDQDADFSCHCVIGMLADKDVITVAQILDPLVSSWYCAGLTDERGQSGDQLATGIKSGAVGADIRSFPDVDRALDAALSAIVGETTSSACILVFGSFLTAGQAISRWPLGH
jgi:dihydrofolate synthase/folylpolyglutamate synthase